MTKLSIADGGVLGILRESNKYPNIVDCSNIKNAPKAKITCIECKFSKDLDLSEVHKFLDGTMICTKDDRVKYVMLDNNCIFAETRTK